ncbi:MAG TPA: cytochrome c oxidase subunit II, partial [Terriglobales bacterium]
MMRVAGRKLCRRVSKTLVAFAIIVCSGQTMLAAPDTYMFAPVATPAHSIMRLAVFVLALAAGIWTILAALTLYGIVKYRARKGDEHIEPPQVFGSTEIELAWTIIPILIIVILFLTTAGVLFGMQHASKPKSALDVVVIGHQFWWEFRYPGLNISTANELHLPVSDQRDPRPVFMKLTSADVIHSFWIPRIAGKVDVIPNRINELWVDPRIPGLYLGQCAQLCGAEHAKMLLRVFVDTPDQFEAWVRQQQKPANEDA